MVKFRWEKLKRTHTQTSGFPGLIDWKYKCFKNCAAFPCASLLTLAALFAVLWTAFETFFVAVVFRIGLDINKRINLYTNEESHRYVGVPSLALLLGLLASLDQNSPADAYKKNPLLWPPGHVLAHILNHSSFSLLEDSTNNFFF